MAQSILRWREFKFVEMKVNFFRVYNSKIVKMHYFHKTISTQLGTKHSCLNKTSAFTIKGLFYCQKAAKFFFLFFNVIIYYSFAEYLFIDWIYFSGKRWGLCTCCEKLFEQHCVKVGQNWPMFSRRGVFLESRRCIFAHYFAIISSKKKTLLLNKLEPPSPKDPLCQIRLN